MTSTTATEPMTRREQNRLAVEAARARLFDGDGLTVCPKCESIDTIVEVERGYQRNAFWFNGEFIDYAESDFELEGTITYECESCDADVSLEFHSVVS